MPDAYLAAMMSGESFRKKDVADRPSVRKSKYDKAIEKQINQYIDSLNLEAAYATNRLLPPAAHRAKIMAEMKEAFSLSELDAYFTPSFDLLLSTGRDYLDPDANHEMQKTLSQIPEVIEKIDLDQEYTDSFQKLLGVSDGVMKSIVQIAQAQFEEEKFENCLSLFVVLSILAPENFDYWFRLGIAAQKAQKNDLALRAYRQAIDLNPKLVLALLFSVECYLSMDLSEQAKATLAEANRIAETTEIEGAWRPLLQEMNALLKET